MSRRLPVTIEPQGPASSSTLARATACIVRCHHNCADGVGAACCSASHHNGGEDGKRFVNASHPVAVTSSVCSNCALLLPSLVVHVHSSGQCVSFHTPALIMGSIENVMPSRMMPFACSGLLVKWTSVVTHRHKYGADGLHKDLLWQEHRRPLSRSCCSRQQDKIHAQLSEAESCCLPAGTHILFHTIDAYLIAGIVGDARRTMKQISNAMPTVRPYN